MDSSSNNPTVTPEGAEFARIMVWLLRVQAVLTVLVAIALALLAGRAAALAGVAGGGIGLLLTAVAALRVGMSLGRDPGVMTAAFYRAMTVKLALAVILFVIVAKWFAVYFVPVLTGYIATLVAYWMAMWRLGRMSVETKPQDG